MTPGHYSTGVIIRRYRCTYDWNIVNCDVKQPIHYKNSSYGFILVICYLDHVCIIYTCIVHAYLSVCSFDDICVVVIVVFSEVMFDTHQFSENYAIRDCIYFIIISIYSIFQSSPLTVLRLLLTVLQLQQMVFQEDRQLSPQMEPQW